MKQGFIFNISEKAKDHLLAILKCDEAFLIDITPGGCNGFSYKYGITNSNNLDNTNEKVSEVPPVLLTAQATDMLHDAILKYEADEFGNSFFAIINPSATSKCGCGNSFTTVT